jgi:peptidoglycan/xylan/chitin deacetylase (PgdA/CDA1 family)
MALIRLIFLLLAAFGAWWLYDLVHDRHLQPSDLRSWFAEPEEIGRRPGDALLRLGISRDAVKSVDQAGSLRYAGLTEYLNGAKAVVTHTVDDSHRDVPRVIEILDRYNVKATFFVSTRRGPIGELWPALAQAARNGHEIGSHARTHPCQFPPDARFCFVAYSDWELAGSRDDILEHVQQPYVWSLAYPCGLCSEYAFARRKLRHAGYLVARIYPDEEHGGHLVPDLKTYDTNRYQAIYTQAVQTVGGIAPEGRTDLGAINQKFDEVYESGGIYNFMTHPQWIDFDPAAFYEQHIKHISGRPDVWYVPMGPLYAYADVREHTEVCPLGDGRFAVVHDLNPGIYPNTVTLEFSVDRPGRWRVSAGSEELPGRPAVPTTGWQEQFWRQEEGRLLVTVRPNAILEIHPAE